MISLRLARAKRIAEGAPSRPPFTSPLCDCLVGNQLIGNASGGIGQIAERTNIIDVVVPARGGKQLSIVCGPA